MPLERNYVVLLGPKPREFDGQRTRNVELQPCGCWVGEVWRAPMIFNATKNEFESGTVFQWNSETSQCATHSAVAVVLQLDLARLLEGQRGDAPPKRISEETYLAKLGDGAQRLYADKQNVLAKAQALDEEIKALGSNVKRKLLGPKDKL